MERTMRILARMFEQNGTLYIGAAIAIIVLIVLVTVARRMRAKAVNQASADNAVKSPMAADDIELTMIDDAASSGVDEPVVFELDETTTEQFNPDQLDQAAAHQFDIDEQQK